MTEFWKDAPVKPFSDWRTYSMLVPIAFGTIGACIFMALGFSFTEMGAISASVRTALVILASFSVAIGSTFGSVGSGIEVFRKRFRKEIEAWDWISLGISTATTIAGFAMGFAALLGATTNWSAVAQVYGSVVVGTLAALDSLGDMIELGGLLGSYELRMDTWLEERRAYNEQHHIVERVEPGPDWEQARIGDFRSLWSSLNGERATMGRDELERALAGRQLRMPPDSTWKRWLRDA